jgi:hypothetical protein
LADSIVVQSTRSTSLSEVDRHALTVCTHSFSAHVPTQILRHLTDDFVGGRQYRFGEHHWWTGQTDIIGSMHDWGHA